MRERLTEEKEESATIWSWKGFSGIPRLVPIEQLLEYESTFTVLSDGNWTDLKQDRSVVNQKVDKG